MARKRMISPDYCVDEVLADLPETDGHLFILSWMHADDEGRLLDSARVLRGLCFPLRADVTVRQVADRIDRLVQARCFVRYQAAGQQYLQIRTWKKHQNINRPTPSRLPECPATLLSESSVSPQASRARAESRVVEEKRREVRVEQPPTPTPETAAADAALRPAIFVAFERELGQLLTPVVASELEDWAKDVGPQWVLDSIKEAVDHNAKTWAYCRSCLRNWKAKGRNNGRAQLQQPLRAGATGHSAPDGEAERDAAEREKWLRVKAELDAESSPRLP